MIGQNEDLRDEIRKIIMYDTEIDWKKTPEIVISIIDIDSTYNFSFVDFDQSKDNQYNQLSLFEIGSVSKVFTSSLISILIEEGVIAATDKVNEFLDIDFQNPRLDHLTINDLVTHYSYFPKRPEGFGVKEKDPQNPYAYYNKADLLEYYREYVPRAEQDFKYSHVNYALLEIIIEKATRKRYETNLREKLFDPLNLDNTFVQFSENNTEKLSTGFDRAHRKTQAWDFKSFAGSEGLKSSAQDLTKFIRANMKLSRTALDDILYKNHNIERLTDLNDNIYIGKAWHIIDHGKKYDIVMHSGKTSGHNCFIAFVPETLTGVVVLCNSSYGAQDLGFLILRMINHNWKRKAHDQ